MRITGRLLLTWILTISVPLTLLSVGTPEARAHCGDCPVPMSAWVGNWPTKIQGLNIEIRRGGPHSKTYAVKVVRMHDQTVLAIGTARIEGHGRSLIARLKDPSGNSMLARLSFAQWDNELMMDMDFLQP